MKFNNFQRHVEEKFSALFYSYGLVVGRHPVFFVALPLILSLISAYGIVHLRVETESRMVYMSQTSMANEEREAFLTFLNVSSLPYFYDLFIFRRDGGAMLEASTIAHVLDLYNRTFHEISFEENGTRLTFQDLCARGYRCTKFDKHFHTFTRLFLNESLRWNPAARLTFPIAEVYGVKMNLIWSLANVSTDARDRIEQARILRIFFLAQTSRDLSDWEKREANRLFAAFGNVFSDYFWDLDAKQVKGLHYYARHEAAYDAAVNEVANKLTPYLAVSLAALFAFTICSSFTRSARTSKPLEAIAGIMNPALAIVTTVGLLNWINPGAFGWNGLAGMMPFLVLAIGVDDMFVLLSAWKSTSPTLKPEERLARVLSDAGLSICVTSVTNFVSFAAGVSTGTKAIYVLSVYASVALAIEFFYQITFFAGVMALGGRTEAEGKHAFSLCWSRDTTPCTTLSVMCKQSTFIYDKSKVTNYRSIIDRLITIWTHPVGTCLLYLLFLFYLVFVLTYTSLVKAHFSGLQAIEEGSREYLFLDFAHRWVFKYDVVAGVVRRPPNFDSALETRQFERFLRDLETIPRYSIGRDATEIWLRPFDTWLDWTTNAEGFYQNLDRWLHLLPFDSDWPFDLQRNVSGIDAFTFRIYLQNIGPFGERARAMLAWRDIASRYPQFDTLLFNEYAIFCDQILISNDNVMQDAGAAIIVIVGLSLLMIPDRMTMFWTIYYLLTVEAGVIGVLKFAVDADAGPVVGTTLTMSVGFSVDYLLHASHCFRNTPESACFADRVRGTLRAIGWPIIQASISTCLGVLGMAFINAFMIRVFFITVFTVAILGSVHGLVILPITLALMS